MLRKFSFLNKIVCFKSHDIAQSSRSYVRRSRDPGIRHRLKLFSDDFVDNDIEFLEEEPESDFMNVGKAHKEFVAEEEKNREKLSTVIVGRKYFKERSINFLTFSEKEQIKQLHQKNPQEWHADKLSESFPADPLTISKIIRNKWEPKDAKRVQKHDESVRKSWQKFKAGELEVEPVLADHLQKFAHRDFNETAKLKHERKFGTEIPKPSWNEFSSIITSCKKYAEKAPKVLKIQGNGLKLPDHHSTNQDVDSYILQGSVHNSDTRSQTLEQYRQNRLDIQLSEKEDRDEKFQLHQKEEVEEVPQVDYRNIQKYQTMEAGAASLQFSNKQVFRSLEIKEHIEIPKNVWQEGKTYKVGDCYYDDDGEFLYRVPGLK